MLHIVLCPTVYNHLFRRKIEQEKYILVRATNDELINLICYPDKKKLDFMHHLN